MVLHCHSLNIYVNYKVPNPPILLLMLNHIRGKFPSGEHTILWNNDIPLIFAMKRFLLHMFSVQATGDKSPISCYV